MASTHSLKKIRELLILANLPQIREKEDLWFEKNEKILLLTGHQNKVWKNKILCFREGDKVTLKNIYSKLASLGYERNSELERGQYKITGGIIHISPINKKNIYSVEMTGNKIESIWEGNISDAQSIKQKKALNNLSLLASGDYVVHKDHGIGIYRGIEIKRGENFFSIEYAPPSGRSTSDMLYVPFAGLDNISPYVGLSTPRIHRLGTSAWQNTLKKVKKDTIKFARELLSTVAEREIKKRNPFVIDLNSNSALETSFKHTLTPSQETAVREIFSDLKSDRPMDRLLMGDVGFGKTEIAIRTSLQAVINGYQVAVLSPTTILADQHFNTFLSRLDSHGVVTNRLSRLENEKEIKRIIKSVSDGSSDILIGTHRILSGDVSFKRLGLLIIDEEQKFGVRAKEHLKKMSSSVDILTLSATPLPRTLNLALSSLKSMSLLSDAPEGRIAPKTYVMPYKKTSAEEAILKEKKRNGQTYFLANRISDIPHLFAELKKNLKNINIGFLHGRLNESIIHKTMNEFRKGNIDVLITTTIIESGIDLSNVNTLLVHDSTRIGLSDAHQLRGRIGRGKVQSHAYFFYPSYLSSLFKDTGDRKKIIKKSKALDRLDVLTNTQFLGSGEVIARKDLEMRGIGNVLGAEQSGHAYKIGLNLYCEMLNDAVNTIKKLENI